MLENLLHSARLRAPSDLLDRRLDRLFALDESSRPSRMRLLPLALAAGLLIVTAPAIWFLRTTSVPPVAARMTTSAPATDAGEVRIERDVSRLIDDGIVAVSDNTPYQQIRRQTVREIWLIDPRTHARLLVRVPSEQVLVQKVEAF